MPQPRHVVERIQAAAGGDSEAFAELFDRHVPETWGLAWAAALDRQVSALALADGFAWALRAVRYQPERAGRFTGDLYRSVYQAAVREGRALEVGARAGEVLVAPVDLGGLEVAPAGPLPHQVEAFRGLPERWRASLWLDACGFGAAAAADVLNVPLETAQQLLVKAETALRRHLQLAAEEAPAVLGPAILALVPPMPIGMAGRALRRWRIVTLDRPARSPLGLPAWKAGSAWRPAATACAAILAAGAIGVGMLSDHRPITSGSPARTSLSSPSIDAQVPVAVPFGTAPSRAHRLEPATTPRARRANQLAQLTVHPATSPSSRSTERPASVPPGRMSGRPLTLTSETAARFGSAAHSHSAARAGSAAHSGFAVRSGSAAHSHSAARAGSATTFEADARPESAVTFVAASSTAGGQGTSNGNSHGTSNGNSQGTSNAGSQGSSNAGSQSNTNGNSREAAQPSGLSTAGTITATASTITGTASTITGTAGTITGTSGTHATPDQALPANRANAAEQADSLCPTSSQLTHPADPAVVQTTEPASQTDPAQQSDPFGQTVTQLAQVATRPASAATGLLSASLAGSNANPAATAQSLGNDQTNTATNDQTDTATNHQTGVAGH